MIDGANLLNLLLWGWDVFTRALRDKCESDEAAALADAAND